MLRNDVRRIVAVLLLVLTLAPAISWAAERRIEPLDRAVVLKSRLLPAMWGFLRAVWDEEGLSLDLDGQPRPNAGSDLDPDGSTTDEGSDLDPNG